MTKEVSLYYDCYGHLYSREKWIMIIEGDLDYYWLQAWKINNTRPHYTRREFAAQTFEQRVKQGIYRFYDVVEIDD